MAMVGLLYILTALLLWFIPLYIFRQWLVYKKGYMVDKPMTFIVTTYITTVVLAYLLDMSMASMVNSSTAVSIQNKDTVLIAILIFNYLLSPFVSVLVWRSIMAKKKVA